MKLGIEYELFVKRVCEMLISMDFPECTVQHHVFLEGHGGIVHEIDVYWEFTVAGITYRTAVECKGYNTRVSKQKIAAFRSILDDIGGIRGIYATKIGYQSGAKKFAKQYGIELLEIRHPEEKDFKDKTTEANINFITQKPINIQMGVSIDSSKLNGSEKIPEFFSVEEIGSSRLLFDKMNPDINAEKVQMLIDNLPYGKEGQKLFFTYKFKNGYLVYNNCLLPITSLSFDYQTSYSKHEIVVKANPDLLVYINNVIKGQDVIKTMDGGTFKSILQEL